MGKRVPKYTEEFKRSLVSLYHSGRTNSQLCKEFGISSATLYNWVKTFSGEKAEDTTQSPLKKFHEQLRLIERLEEENRILKQALAILTPH